jgi:acyl carrier protein
MRYTEYGGLTHGVGVIVTRAEVLSRLQTVFDDVFIEPVQVTASLSAADVAEWSSVQHVSLVLSVESAFGIRFRVGEVELANNVGELADIIVRHVGEGKRP